MKDRRATTEAHDAAPRGRGRGAFFAALLLPVVLAAAWLWMLGGRLSSPVPRFVGSPPDSLVGASDVTFPSESGSTIRGWFAQGDSGRPCIVLAHAVRGDRRGVLARALFLRRDGYSVLLFDAQAHGESPGERITFGVREAHDAVAAVAFVRSRCNGAPVGYIGVSQGGAAALLGGAPLAAQALVLEAVYPTLERALENRIAIRLGAAGRWLAPLLSWQLGPRLGIDIESVAPIDGIRDVRAPLLLIAGEIDEHTQLSESRALFRAAPEPKSLWVVPGAAHVDLHGFATAEYERRVRAFLADAFGGR